jgi:hypothetical protein
LFQSKGFHTIIIFLKIQNVIDIRTTNARTLRIITTTKYSEIYQTMHEQSNMVRILVLIDQYITKTVWYLAKTSGKQSQ